ncbi:hypothetical protein D3C74_448110 [compost metagenome]
MALNDPEGCDSDGHPKRTDEVQRCAGRAALLGGQAMDCGRTEHREGGADSESDEDHIERDEKARGIRCQGRD